MYSLISPVVPAVFVTIIKGVGLEGEHRREVDRLSPRFFTPDMRCNMKRDGEGKSKMTGDGEIEEWVQSLLRHTPLGQFDPLMHTMPPVLARVNLI